MLTRNLGHVTFRCGAVFFTQPGYQLNAQCNVHCRPHVCELTPLRATVRGESTTLLLSQPGEDLSGGHLSLVMVKGLG